MDEKKYEIVAMALSHFEYREGSLVKLAEFNDVLRSIMKIKDFKARIGEMDEYIVLVDSRHKPIIKYFDSKGAKYVSNLQRKGINNG